VRGYGRTREEALEQAALALVGAIADPASVVPRTFVPISVAAGDDETMLYDWLNAVVYEMASRHMLFSRFELRPEGQGLAGGAWGERVEVARHQPASEVKAATFTDLSVAHTVESGWRAQCIIDI
jgi:SHS2 domain-containing protein